LSMKSMTGGFTTTVSVPAYSTVAIRIARKG
jgi:hypothetical protein